MKKSILGMIAIALLSTGIAKAAESDYEGMCRIKAKEVAAESYRGCVTEARTSQIEQLKKEYQDKLKAMKDDYEKEIKRLSAGSAAQAKANAKEAAKEAKEAKKAARKSAKSKLPAKDASKISSDKSVGAPAQASNDGMNLELKPASASKASQGEESMMDIPEPTPIEEVPTAQN